MPPKMLNDLRFYTLSVTESVEMAQQKEQWFIDKFNKLGKYDAMDMGIMIDTYGWDKAFEVIEHM